MGLTRNEWDSFHDGKSVILYCEEKHIESAVWHDTSPVEEYLSEGDYAEYDTDLIATDLFRIDQDLAKAESEFDWAMAMQERWANIEDFTIMLTRMRFKDLDYVYRKWVENSELTEIIDNGFPVRIDVNEEHLKQGIKDSSESCPVALALKETSLYIPGEGLDVDEYGEVTIGWNRYQTNAKNRIREFDAGHPGDPFTMKIWRGMDDIHLTRKHKRFYP